MKKLIALVLMILTINYGALAEDTITFRDVPWGVTPSEFQLALWEEGTYFDDLEVFSEEHYSFLKSDVYGSYGVEPRWGSKRLCYYSFYWGEGRDYACIAGSYEIDRISAQFLPTYSGTRLNRPGLETSQLHQVTYVINSFRQKGDIIDKEVAFYDLVDRFTEVYGESENKPTLSTPIARYWVADDGTSVIIKPVQFDTKYPAIHIEYRSAIDQDYITGLVEAYNTTMNTEGGL